MVIHALEEQRSGTKAGEIRVGMRNGKGNPISLERFRLTTKWERVAETVAATFGGKPNWTTLANGEKTIEVMTETANLSVLVPPFVAVIDQWREMWGNGFCMRRCDSITEKKSGNPCMCPADDLERKELAKDGKACKDTTRLFLMLPDICTGVWKVVTGSGNAAREVSDSTDLLGAAAAQNVWLPATLRLDRRKEKYLIKGETKTFKFPVVALIPDDSPRAILSGQLGAGIAAALPSSPTLALGSGTERPVDVQLSEAARALNVQSDDELASSGQRSAIRARLALLSPADKATFDRWIDNEKKVGGIHAFAQLRASEVDLVMAKLDVLDPDNAPPEWDEDEPIDAEIVEEGML